MLDDARPPVGKKPLDNLTALNLRGNYPPCNAVKGGGQNSFSAFFAPKHSSKLYIAKTYKAGLLHEV